MRFTPACLPLRCLIKCAAIIAAICCVGPECRAQDKPAGGQTQTSSLQSLEKYPGLHMKFGGWQRLNAEYAKRFGVETPNW